MLRIRAGRLPRRSVRAIALTIVVAAAAGAGATALPAQVPRPRWTISGGASAIRVGQREGWGYGPELRVRRDFGESWGVGLTLSLPAFGADAGGAAVDLGPTLTVVRGRTELGLAAGLTAFLLGDSSELVGGGIGTFAGAHAGTWLTQGLGLFVASDLRFSFHDQLHLYPSVTGGVAVRF